MRKVILYLAMSLDGYLADAEGGVGWLLGDGSMEGHPGSYPGFIETVDTVILGYKTYHQIVTELSPDSWMYSGKTSYVLTHREEISTDEIIFTKEAPESLIERLRVQEGRNIWLCGGASVINQLHGKDLIDRYHFTVIPTILGEGIPVFSVHDRERALSLVSTESYNGMVDLVYERRNSLE